MSLLSRRAMLKTGLAAVPAMTLQSAPSVAQTCSAPQACNIVPPSTLRQVATGCHTPDLEYPGVPAVLSRSPHFNRSGLTQSTLRIAVPNCVGSTAYPFSPKTWQAVIEYPLNTLTTVTWGGQDVVTGPITSPPGTQGPPLFVMSDEICLTVPIPDNALFWVRLSQTDGTGAKRLLCQNIGNLNSTNANMQRSFNQALGETNCAADASLLKNPVMQDPTRGIWAFTGGGIIYGNSAALWASVRPMAILGQSRKSAFSLWGDSRVVGIGDTFDGACDDRGEVERSIGPAYAYINLAVPSKPLADLSAILTDQQFIGLAPHLVLGQYTTHLIENLGGADCIKVATDNLKDPTNATTSDQFKAEFKANKASLWSAWTGLGRSPYSLSSLTFPPSPSTDVPQQNAFLKDVTDTLRAGIIMVDSQRNPLLDANNNPIKARVIDVASIVGLASGSDWICADYSADTQHESQAGCLAISESGIIDPYALTR